MGDRFPAAQTIRLLADDQNGESSCRCLLIFPTVVRDLLGAAPLGRAFFLFDMYRSLCNVLCAIWQDKCNHTIM